MKNTHILPTDKPSRLYKTGNFLLLDSKAMPNNILETKNQHIYITSDEEIKPNVYALINGVLCKTELLDGRIVSRQLTGGATMDICKSEYSEITLTDNKDLIKDGVQAIDDDFLEWFVKNPNCEEIEIIYGLFNAMGRQVDPMNLSQNHSQCVWKYKIIIPKEEPKQETLTNVAEKFSELQEGTYTPQHKVTYQHGFIDGAKWQQEQDKKLYSEEDVNEIIAEAWNSCEDNEGETYTEARKRIIEQLKKK